MKKISALLALVLLGWAANAQSTDNNSSDTTHRRGYHNWANRDGRDSAHRKNFRGFDRNRGEAMNRFDNRDGYERNRFGAFRNHRRFGNEMARIHFTPDQRKQMQDINKEYRKKQSDLYKNDNLTLGAYKSQLLALQKEKKNKIQGLITPEQKNQIAEWKKKRSENAQVMAAAHLERMKIKLNLTDAQAATIKTQQQNMRKQMQSIRENDNLMREQKMEQMKALFAKNKEAMKSVLTPEQFSQLENMHKKFGDRFGAK
jgi:Spy/CpxP family protein refolding chaperone